MLVIIFIVRFFPDGEGVLLDFPALKRNPCVFVVESSDGNGHAVLVSLFPVDHLRLQSEHDRLVSTL